MVYGVSVTPANVVPSTVNHGRTLHQPRDSRICLSMLSTATPCITSWQLSITAVPVTEFIYCGTVADWPMGQNLFLMSHPDVSLVNILLSITRVSLVQNKCVFCQLRVHFIGDPDITKTYLGIQHANIVQYLHELNGNVHYINIFNVPTLNCAACKLQRVNRDERRQLYNCAAYRLQRFNRDEHSAVREQWIRPIPMLSV